MQLTRFSAAILGALLSSATLVAPTLTHAAPPDEFEKMERYIAVSDIEGMKSHWRTLIKNKNVSFNRVTRLLEVMDPKTRIWFIGDLMRRGPYGKATYQYVLNMMKYQPNQALGIIGNHDGNILSFLAAVSGIENNALPEYDEWFAKQVLKDPDLRPGRYAQMQWWSEKYGLKDKTLNWWIEMAAEARKVDPMAHSFQKLINGPDGKVDLAKLSRIVDAETAAESFYRFCAPGGLGFEYMERASLVNVVDSKEGIRTLLLHSGTVTKGNLGVIPGANDTYYRAHPDKDWIKLWAEDLNGWKNDNLKRMANLHHRLQSTSRLSAEARKQLAEEMLKVHLIRYVDAGYDAVTRTLEYEANSVVYPEKYTQRMSSIPGTFTPEINDLLASPQVRVDNIYGGHIPVGDRAVVRRSYSLKHKRFINAILGDTSYSPVEGNDHLVFRSDGYIRLNGGTRSGKQYVTEILPEALAKKYLESGDPALVKKAQQIEKIGMLADGYLIAGFEAAHDPLNNTFTPDYDKYVLLRQKGYDFEYKHVDVWGMEEYLKHNELKFPVADFEAAYQAAYDDKIKMLESHKKVAITDRDFIKLLEGKSVIISSGPANASLNPVLDSVNGNPDNVKALLQDWREYLLRLPANGDFVLVGGGTSGLEELKNQVAAEVNKHRISKGAKPFEIVGVITGVTGGSELDGNVQKFVVSNAFFWDDYFPELMGMVKKAKSIKNLRLEFAGGGGIIPTQIEVARTFKMLGLDMDLVLFQGISAKTGKLAVSGTDKVINAALADARGSRDVKIRKLEEFHRYSTAVACIPKAPRCLRMLHHVDKPLCP